MAREQHEALDLERTAREEAVLGEELHHLLAWACAQPRQRHVRREFALFGGQSDALQVTSVLNVFSTVGSGTGARLNSSAALDGQTQRQVIYNGGANVLKVYPATGQSINQLAANAGMTLPRFTTCVYYLVSSTQWIAVLSA